MRPSIGRIVLYWTEDGQQVPAIITGIKNDTKVNLRVFYNDFRDVHFFENVREGTGKGEWAWPPRLDISTPISQGSTSPGTALPANIAAAFENAKKQQG